MLLSDEFVNMLFCTSGKNLIIIGVMNLIHEYTGVVHGKW